MTCSNYNIYNIFVNMHEMRCTKHFVCFFYFQIADLKSGDYIPLGINSPCSSLCASGDCCDKNALCTCGTTTGHYSCICQLGYYGSGFQNSCSRKLNYKKCFHTNCY